jgi:hypothetical protein
MDQYRAQLLALRSDPNSFYGQYYYLQQVLFYRLPLQTVFYCTITNKSNADVYFFSHLKCNHTVKHRQFVVRLN